jgi:hypothetical protein
MAAAIHKTEIYTRRMAAFRSEAEVRNEQSLMAGNGQ